jgi:hypothetical protein
MELILRGSEYESFLNCRKQWYYAWVEKLQAKKPDAKLFFGTVFHKWLENYYKNGCNAIQADMETTFWFNEQNLKDMPQEEIDDMKKLFRGVRDNYVETWYKDDFQNTVIGTEITFGVLLQEDIYYTGTIDLVYLTPEGKLRFADHKTVSSISMYEEKSKMDRQISRYWWVMQKLTQGIAVIKNEAGEWVKWDRVLGLDVDGFTYNLIGKDFPKEPKQLKPKKGETVGALSQDKSQKTTYKKYAQAIINLGLDHNDYLEMLAMLKNKPDQFCKRIDVIRNQNELDSAMWEFLYTAGDIHDVKLIVTENPQMSEQVCYRNIGTHCQNMCQFKSLCQTTIEGGHVAMVKNLGYKTREEN